MLHKIELDRAVNAKGQRGQLQPQFLADQFTQSKGAGYAQTHFYLPPSWLSDLPSGSRKVRRRLNQLDRAEIPCNTRRDHPLPILVELSILRVYYSVLNERVLSRFKSQVAHLKLTFCILAKLEVMWSIKFVLVKGNKVWNSRWEKENNHQSI